MKKTILIEKAELRKVNTIRDRIMQNTYTNQDLILLFGIIKNNSEKLDAYQIKGLCELIQFLFAVEHHDRLPEELLELVDRTLIVNTLYKNHGIKGDSPWQVRENISDTART